MYTTRVNTYLHTEMWRWHTVHKLKYHKLPIWQQPTLASYLLPSDAELMEKTSPTAGLFSSWLRLRHKAAPSASRLFSVTHGSTIRLLCLQKKSLPLTALLWDCQHERGGLSIKMTGMSGVYSEQELRISSASFFFSPPASHEHLQTRQNALSQPSFIEFVFTPVLQRHTVACA